MPKLTAQNRAEGLAAMLAAERERIAGCRKVIRASNNPDEIERAVHDLATAETRVATLERLTKER